MILIPGIPCQEEANKEGRKGGAWLSMARQHGSINTKTWSTDAGTGAEC
jgi:hypothetical protein